MFESELAFDLSAESCIADALASEIFDHQLQLLS